MAVGKSGAKQKKMPRGTPTGNKRVSAGPIENLAAQKSLMENFRPGDAKRKSQTVPPPIPPQPFAAPVGERNLV
jgi:hypothetical protein